MADTNAESSRFGRFWEKYRFPVTAAFLGIVTALFAIFSHMAGAPGKLLWLNIGLLAVLWVAGMTKFRLPRIVTVLMLLPVPALHYILLELIQQHSRDIVPKMHWLNLAFFYLAFSVLLLLFYKKSQFAVLTGTVLTCAWAVVNSCAWQYRSLPVLPWDIVSVKVALSVSNEYIYDFSPLFWTVMLSFLCIAFLGFRFPVEERVYLKKKFHFPLAGVGAGLLVALIVFFQSDAVFDRFGGYRYLFTPTVYYERNGTAVSFLSTLRYLVIRHPANYSVPALKTKAEPYVQKAAEDKAEILEKAEKAEEKTDVLPNIIVIMNEAFSDLRPLGEFTTDNPVTPFIDSLYENTVRGKLYVSVKGGNTANTEFEFLTGNSMAFLPTGSIPYQQYVRDEMPTFVTQLEALGYATQATHPYYASGWNRDTVYPDFGFDTTTFLEDLRPLYTSQVLRSYYSDKALYKILIEHYENKEEGKPLFQFCVTMQNHGSYDQEYANFIPDVHVEGVDPETTTGKRLSAYLSLIRRSDEAFRTLVEYFEKQDEHTVIVMFGDHQPNDNVISPILKLNGIPATSDNMNEINRYITPLIIWANYDIEEEDLGEISANYLSGALCEIAGLPLSGYQQYLGEIREAFPEVTSRSVIDNGEFFNAGHISALIKDKSSPLGLYQLFQYNHIFDKKHRIPGFFD